MTHETLAAWLDRYRDAWERRDPAAAAALFSDDAEYWWTPFGPPKRGPGEVATAWAAATVRQRDVRFTWRILAIAAGTGIVHWHTRLTRAATGAAVEIDGILTVVLGADGRCREFREWWHSDEAAGA